MKRRLLILVLMMASALLSAQIINVPGDQPSIQAGIDAATNGDTVLVAEGTYLENINFKGKAITLASNYLINADTNIINNTIIDGSMPGLSDSASVVVFNSGEDTTSILYGFSITGGSGGCYNAAWDCNYGAGIAFNEGGGRISHNKIYNNELNTDAFGSAGAGIGGLMNSETPWVIIEHNTIYDNFSNSSNYSGFGGGIYLSTNCKIYSNRIYNNSCLGTNGAFASGGGLEVEALPGDIIEYSIENNEIFNNSIDGEYVYGAGISVLGGKGNVSDNHIYANTANAVNRCFGGGLRILGANNTITIENNIIQGNVMMAEYVQGGGIDIGGVGSKAVILNNEVYENEIIGTTAAWGGGMNFAQDHVLLITGNRIQDNEISGGSWWCGAGIYSEDLYGYLEVNHNIIQDNVGTGTSYGGGIGIYDSEGASYNIGSNLIMRNHCNYGAGIWTFNTYDISMTNNLFVENMAWSWGGAYALRQGSDDSPLNISIAYSMGEEVTFNNASDAELHPFVANNTFFKNTAGSYSGAIDSDQDEYVPIILNNIFWENSAPNANNIWYGGPDTLIISHCDIDEADSSILANYTGHGNFFDDPVFEPGDSLCCINGGPCHNTGTDEIEIDGVVYSAPDVDYRGTARPQGAGWDIGAHECLMIFVREVENENLFNLSLHPNPSSGALHLQYSLPNTQYSILELYAVDGAKVKTLKQGVLQSGKYEQTFDVSDLPDGLYFVRLQAGERVESQKLILLK